jgi:hypothetical protein
MLPGEKADDGDNRDRHNLRGKAKPGGETNVTNRKEIDEKQNPRIENIVRHRDP